MCFTKFLYLYKWFESYTMKSIKTLDVQLKPLNVVTLGLTKSGNINELITITGNINLVTINKCDVDIINQSLL